MLKYLMLIIWLIELATKKSLIFHWRRLEIKQAAEGTQEVPGLVEVRVFSTEEVWEILRSGSRARSVGSTSANELSSRSHWYIVNPAIFP